MKTCQLPACECTDFNRAFCKHYQVPKKEKRPRLTKKAFQVCRKPTGELEFFKREWEKRGGFCFVTDESIEFSIFACFHILGKKAFPKYRLLAENLIFVKPQYHMNWHDKDREDLLKIDGRWQKVFELYDNLKIKYHNGTNQLHSRR